MCRSSWPVHVNMPSLFAGYSADLYLCTTLNETMRRGNPKKSIGLLLIFLGASLLSPFLSSPHQRDRYKEPVYNAYSAQQMRNEGDIKS